MPSGRPVAFAAAALTAPSTVPDGTAWDDSLDCDNWSSSAFEENARQGVTGYTDSRWSDDTFLTDCGSGGLLYCSEQE